jgi:cell division protein FtsQ
VKEGKSRRRAGLWVIAVGGVLITAAITLYTPWLPIFDLREIAVSGGRRVSVDEVVRSADLRRGQPLPTIPVRAVATRVSALPWVKSVAVRRIYPHRISIEIRERAPVARAVVDDGGCLTLGEGGVVVEANCDADGFLVELQGAPFSGEAPGARSLDERVTDLVDVLYRVSLPEVNVTRIDVSDPGSIVLTAEPDLRILLGSIEETAARVERLVALCRAVDVGDYELIDLRLEGEATLVPR